MRFYNLRAFAMAMGCLAIASNGASALTISDLLLGNGGQSEGGGHVFNPKPNPEPPNFGTDVFEESAPYTPAVVPLPPSALLMAPALLALAALARRRDRGRD